MGLLFKTILNTGNQKILSENIIFHIDAFKSSNVDQKLNFLQYYFNLTFIKACTLLFLFLLKSYDIWIFRIMIISIRIIMIYDKFVFHFFNLISNPIAEKVRKCNFKKNFDANKNTKS